MVKIIFIHGNETMTWKDHWSLYLKKELEKLDVKLVFETFPDSIIARAKYWLPFLKDYLEADEGTLLIGHSSGATAAMRYAEKNRILGSILISPCYTDLGSEEERISGWYDNPWDWEIIKKNQKKIALLYSKDDFVIPVKEFYHIKEQLDPDIVIEFEDKGHFVNQTEFPELVEVVKKMLKER